MRLDKDPFERMAAGKKKIEARLAVDKHKKPRQLNVGDIITFQRSDDNSCHLNVRVAALLYYPSFADLIEDFDPQTYFGRSSQEQLLSNLRARYSQEDEKQYGVVGIKVKVIRTI